MARPGRTLVVCYHAVSETWPAVLAVTPEALESHLERFVKLGFSGATLRDALRGDRRLAPLVAITFDDAYRSVYEVGFPILQRFGIPATVFVPTHHVGNGQPRGWDGTAHWLETPWATELTGASWEQLGELAGAGWEIGSHTRRHPHLPELDDDSLAEELEGSRQDCEQRLGVPCHSLAYPYGEVNQRVRTAADRAGYEVATALSERLPVRADEVDRLRWPRLEVYRRDTDSRLAVKAWIYRHAPRTWNSAQTGRRLAQRARGLPTPARPGRSSPPS